MIGSQGGMIMNSYNISLWENTRRLRVLGEFRNDVVAALEDVHQLPPVVLPGLGVQTELATCPSRLDPWFPPLKGRFRLQNRLSMAITASLGASQVTRHP